MTTQENTSGTTPGYTPYTQPHDKESLAALGFGARQRFMLWLCDLGTALLGEHPVSPSQQWLSDQIIESHRPIAVTAEP